MFIRRSISKKHLFLFLAYAFVGFAMPWQHYPEHHPIQILLPLVFGIAAGSHLARVRGSDDVAQRVPGT